MLNLKKQIENENGRTLLVLCTICGLTNAVYKSFCEAELLKKCGHELYEEIRKKSINIYKRKANYKSNFILQNYFDFFDSKWWIETYNDIKYIIKGKGKVSETSKKCLFRTIYQ